MNRFRFGFAAPGEVLETSGCIATFVGDYSRQWEARKIAEERGATINPYLSGHKKIGWAVYKLQPKEQPCT